MSVLLSTYISAVTGIIARDFLNTLFNQYQCTIQTQSSFFLLFCFCFSLGLCFHLVVFVFCIVLLLFFFFFFFSLLCCCCLLMSSAVSKGLRGSVAGLVIHSEHRSCCYCHHH